MSIENDYRKMKIGQTIVVSSSQMKKTPKGEKLYIGEKVEIEFKDKRSSISAFISDVIGGMIILKTHNNSKAKNDKEKLLIVRSILECIY